MTGPKIVGPAYLTPDWRYAGDDWTGANALTYVVYTTAPVYGSDGVTVATPGVPQDLTGCTVSGQVSYQSLFRRGAGVSPVLNPVSAMPVPTGAVLNATGGVIALSLTRDLTIFPRQFFDSWPAGYAPDPSQALLIIQPRVIAASGRVTVGLQPLFVF